MSKLGSIMWYSIGRFEMLVGIFSLGLATAMLALSRKTSPSLREPNPSEGLSVALLASALTLYSNSKRSPRRKVNNRGPSQS